MKVIGINGSPRKEGNTSRMIKKVLSVLEGDGCETGYIQLGGEVIHGCTACYRCGKNLNKKCAIGNDCFNDIFEKMIEADGIIIGSPTYFTDVTTEIKALIDRAGFVARSNGNLLQHKAGAAVIAVRRGGGMHAFDTINHLFLISRMFIAGSSYWNLGFGGGVGEVENDAEGMKTLEHLGESMAFLLNKLHP
jgi:multimeric flavodoxin WrbA